MRLKQIKLAGFKSFVDPTTVTLPGNRCAVVGPNGCGKSNIIDGVRWVMGESSAKQLRGENLTDVIFSGSNSRQPTAVASVELIFDNHEGRIGGEYAAYGEISVRRQVTRDSQSSYFLNGHKCRRRDIMDIFLGTGFGPRSYSIIEQGMIGQLVEAKPEDLRAYLEEAAGISRYKERRRETENRIKHTRENLARLTDIRDELEKQIKHLDRQAKAAGRYRRLKTEETSLTAGLYALRFGALEHQLAEHQSNIQQLEVAYERSAALQQGLDTEIESGRQQHADSSESFNEVQGRYYQLGADIARIEEAIQFNRERVKQLELDLETVQQRTGETSQQLAMDQGQISEIKSQVAALGPAVREAEVADQQAHTLLDELEERYQENQNAWEAFIRAAAENERHAEVQASRIEHLEQLLQRLRGRHEQLTSDAEIMPPSGTEDVNSLAAEIAESEINRRALESEVDVCFSALATAREDVLMRDKVLEDARGEVQALRHDLASLEALQRAALGREARESHEWIEAQGLSAAQRLGEALSVVPGWEQAVETALGDYLQAIRVDDIELYQATFTTFSGGGVTLFEASVDTQKMAGALPSLASLVRSQDLKLGSVLQGIYAAESVAVALANRAALKPGESIVTRQGVWLGPDWIKRVAEPTEASSKGIIHRAQELETLNLRVEEAESTLADLQSHVVEGRARIEQLEGEREAFQLQINQLNQSLGDLKTDHGVRRVQLEEADARRIRLTGERAEIDQQIHEETERLKTARQTLASVLEAQEGQEDKRAGLDNRRQDTQRELELARVSARASRDHFHTLNTQWQGLQSKLAASETARDRLVRQQSELNEQLDVLKQGIANSATPLPELKNELEAKLAERLTVESQLGEVRNALESIDQRIRELEGQRTDTEAGLNDLRGELETARVNRQGLSVQAENITEQLQSTGISLEQAREELPEKATTETWERELERMDRRIQRLGPINLAAIDEFESQSQRKKYLDQQNEDLDQALETLVAAIRKIDRETRQRFKETFEAVNARLGELFPKVFGGGHAYLELTGEDLLDTGVSLMARPPGKRNTSVHLLSGGEKAMTAVALIFAIFHLNPSPVCLLDEVDAPLDDVNVLRFAELIREMSEDVQFVIITHNKLTMEMADHLMGVTMNEPGVSRLVSVDVEEAAAMAV
ncbi:MAG: chromosome segregation protein SMC [Gammaproteobacteria bacterium]|nr:chromosome segregation protein SMC [Gammaproteobacteria bacterium]